VQVNGGGKWKSVSAADNFTCGIKEDETLWCWGGNDEGQLGNGTTNYRSSPTQVPGVWTAVDTGGGSNPSVVCAKKSDSTLWCWGRRAQGAGQLGLGAVVQTATPLRVAGAWGTFGVGRWGTCAIRNTQLWCWGDGYEGNLGRGAGDSHADSGVPLLVRGGGAWASISRGRDHGCFVQTDGTVWCLGENYGSIPLRIPLSGKVLKVIQDDSCDRSSRGRERCRPTR
jgi:hypothetical protein